MSTLTTTTTTHDTVPPDDVCDVPDDAIVSCHLCHDDVVPFTGTTVPETVASNVRDVADVTVCATCADDVFHCDDCGELSSFDDDTVVCVESDRPVCGSCADDYERCHDCDVYRCADDILTTADMGNVCVRCAQSDRWTLCGDCDRYTETEDTVWSEYMDRAICDRCYNRSWHYCETCDDIVPDDADCHDDCDDDCDTGGAEVHGYCYKPSPWFYTTDGPAQTPEPGTLYLGLELETEIGHDRSALGDVDDRWSHCYLKHDGSLSDGVEIVTHPGTLDYHRSVDWSVLDDLRRSGFRSWDTTTCGIHVHLSRDAFAGPSHLWRFTAFILRNDDAVCRFAGRRSTWARFERAELGGTIVAAVKGKPCNRYVAVNHTNDATVEVRVFRGSLLPSTVLGNLEFCAAVFEYTRTLTCRDVLSGAIDWDAFCDWLDARPDAFPALVALVQRRWS